MKLNLLLLILLAAGVTYLPRFLPILALKNADLPSWFQKWMTYLPIAIFASLVATDIFYWDDQLTFDLTTNIKLLPSILTVLVAFKSKNMIYSILTGVIAISLMVWLF